MRARFQAEVSLFLQKGLFIHITPLFMSLLFCAQPLDTNRMQPCFPTAPVPSPHASSLATQMFKGWRYGRPHQVSLGRPEDVVASVFPGFPAARNLQLLCCFFIQMLTSTGIWAFKRFRAVAPRSVSHQQPTFLATLRWAIPQLGPNANHLC